MHAHLTLTPEHWPFFGPSHLSLFKKRLLCNAGAATVAVGGMCENNLSIFFLVFFRFQQEQNN